MNKDLIKIVESVLREHEDARDSDIYLIKYVWLKQLDQDGNGAFEISFDNLFSFLVTGDISLPESISRARRRLQEQIPETRGYAFQDRHSKRPEFNAFLKDARKRRRLFL